MSDAFKKGPINWRKIIGAQGNQVSEARWQSWLLVTCGFLVNGAGGGASALRACTVTVAGGPECMEQASLWRPWDSQGAYLVPAQAVLPEPAFLPSLSGHSQL